MTTDLDQLDLVYVGIILAKTASKESFVLWGSLVDLPLDITIDIAVQRFKSGELSDDMLDGT